VSSPTAASTFSRFPVRLQEAIVSRLGWTGLRPVQELAGAAILDGQNAVVLAPTAGGKTEASFFPVLARLMENPPRESVGALYIAPIKALLNNQAERLGMYTEMVGLRRFLWHGDVTDTERKRFLKEPTELLMTTPESLEVMLLSPKVPHLKLFADLQAVIIDEVHALAGSDRGAHLMCVLERLAAHSRHDISRLGLSATVGNPSDILTWLQGSSHRPGCVIDPPKVPGGRDLSIRYLDSDRLVAEDACRMAAGQKSLFFCQSRSTTESVADCLRGRGIDVFVHHSSVSLEERQAAEARFHHGRNAMIACTSTLELGIDVGDLDRVLQSEAPSTVSSFLQRMGRTGRRQGTRANTVFFCQSPETVLQAAAIIELARSGWVESVTVNDRCWPVLVHQTLALCLQYGSVSAERVWDELRAVPDFAGIGQDEFQELVDHMVTEDFLFRSGGLLAIGDQTEKLYGRKNFMEMYAVFSTPQMYRVVTDAHRDIGSLEQSFVDNLVADISSFLLGGRAWLVLNVNHQEKRVTVMPAPAGRKPTWLGYVPQFLGYKICREMAAILSDLRPLPYLSERAAESLREQRKERGNALRAPGFAIEVHEDEEFLWTFAGGAVNTTIKYALDLLFGWKVTGDNFRLKVIRPHQADQLTVPQALEKLADPATWQDPEFQRRLRLAMPAYRLSKFQPALPPHRSLEVVQNYLLDVPRTLHFLNQQLGRTDRLLPRGLD
jgi:ATP-dependent Lhr-like helicase